MTARNNTKYGQKECQENIASEWKKIIIFTPTESSNQYELSMASEIG
jgi:hypothetical protein